MSGADPRLLIEGDFILLRMALVDELDGDIEAALLFQRMCWRCEQTGTWTATYDEVRAETRLSERKMKRALKVLRDRGWLISQRVSSWDPTQVWQVWIGTSSTEPQRPAREGRNVPHVRDETSRTSLEDVETKNIPPSGDGVPSSGFDSFWAAYPKKVDKKAAVRAWQSEVVKPGINVGTVLVALKVYLAAQKDPRYLKYPATWLRATDFAEATSTSAADRQAYIDSIVKNRSV